MFRLDQTPGAPCRSAVVAAGAPAQPSG